MLDYDPEVVQCWTTTAFPQASRKLSSINPEGYPCTLNLKWFLLPREGGTRGGRS